MLPHSNKCYIKHIQPYWISKRSTTFNIDDIQTQSISNTFNHIQFRTHLTTFDIHSISNTFDISHIQSNSPPTKSNKFNIKHLQLHSISETFKHIQYLPHTTKFNSIHNQTHWISKKIFHIQYKLIQY